MSELDTLLRTARDAEVSREAADAYVRELARWARPAPRRAWLPWAIAATTAAVAAVLLIVVRPAQVRDVESIAVGERVAIVASPGARYRVIAATPDQTRIAV